MLLLPLLATLALLGQTPASTEAPISVVIAPPEAPGVPSAIVSFAEEHVYEQLKTQGLTVVSAAELSQTLPAAERKTVFGCSRQDASCRITLGEAAQADVVMLVELVQFLSGYRVALKAYTTRDGELLADYFVPGVRDDQLLDAFTLATEKVLPVVRRTLRPQSVVPGPTNPTNPTTLPPRTTPQTPQVTLPLTPVPEVKVTRSAAPGWAWVPAAGGAVLLGVGGYFYWQASKADASLRKDTLDRDKATALANSGQRSQQISAVAAGVGAAGVVTTGLIYLLSGRTEVAPGVRTAAMLTPSGAMVGVVGTLP